MPKIYSYSNGDLRKGISLLDYSSTISDNNIKYEDLYLIMGNFQISNFQLLLNKNLSETQIFQFTSEIIKKGYCCRKIIKLFIREIINSDLFSDIEKMTIMSDIYFSEKHIIKGASQFLSLLNIFINFSNNN